MLLKAIISFCLTISPQAYIPHCELLSFPSSCPGSAGGVPLNVMEVTTFPHEGTAEQQQALQTLRELGAQDIKVGRMSKTGEDIMIAIFNTPDGAVKALHMKHPLFSLSIPRNNHAKFIISLLQAVPTP